MYFLKKKTTTTKITDIYTYIMLSKLHTSFGVIVDVDHIHPTYMRSIVEQKKKNEWKKDK